MRQWVGLGGSAARRGFILLALMQIAFGFALNAQQNIVTNYFEGVLHLQGRSSATSPPSARSPASC